MASVDVHAPLRAAAVPSLPGRRRIVQVLLAALAVAVLVVPTDGLSTSGRLALVVFGGAVYLWVATGLNDTFVALGAAMACALVGADEPDAFFSSLGDPTIWLLLGAFVLAAAAKASGLSRRMAVVVVGRAKTVRGLLFGLTGAIALTAFVVPSTSGRAALLVPVFLALAGALDDKRVVRALALLFPTVILLSAVGSLVGAGAHLVTAQVLDQTGNETFGYGRWLLLGAPFALVSCFGSAWAIQRLFLTPEERGRPVALTPADLRGEDGEPTGTGPLTPAERTVLVVTGVLVVLWCTEALHGIDAAFVALAGALAVTAPRVGVMAFKPALKEVDFNILVFLAATLVLGRSLIESGAADWLAENAFGALEGAPKLVVVGAVAALSLLAHLVITSRTARSSVLVPLVVLLGASAGVNPAMLAFVSTAAAGFCLTLPVSAKPVMMFSGLDRPTYDPSDLLRLSRVLLPAHLVALVVFAFAVWPALGLSLAGTATPAQAPAAQAPGGGSPTTITWASDEERADAVREGVLVRRGRDAEREALARAARDAQALRDARSERRRALQRARRAERDLARLRAARRAPAAVPPAPAPNPIAPSSSSDDDDDD